LSRCDPVRFALDSKINSIPKNAEDQDDADSDENLHEGKSSTAVSE
jgi:hypothetical protein